MKHPSSASFRSFPKTVKISGDGTRHRNYLKTFFALVVFSFTVIAAQAAVTADNASADKAVSKPLSVFTVNSLSDDESDGCAVGNCTLREAVNSANNTPQPDTINFAPGLNGTITLTNGQIIAADDMTINGPGARLLSVNGNDASRVFLIATPVLGGNITVNISGLTITNGKALPVLGLAGDGGGILNGALLGIISGTSTLNLTEMTIDGNEATTLGGGIATRLNAVTNIYRSTVSRNVSNALLSNNILSDVGGGGISNVGSTTTIINSTISDNRSLAAGGGILNAAGVVNLTNDTIANNDSTVVGGGLVSAVGVVTPILGVANVRNTIIAKNAGVLDTNIITSDVLGIAGSINSLGNNLIGSNFGAELTVTANSFVSGVWQPQVNGDIVGNITAGNQLIDPLLGNLQNNGGPTDTRLPLTISPAINNGNNCVTDNSCPTALPFPLLTEQRGTGFPRLQNARVEIGAVEIFFAPTAANATITGRALTGDGRGIARALVTLTDSDGTTQTAITNPFGAYRFTRVEVLRTYILQVNHKQYVFSQQIVTPVEDLLEINLIGTSSERDFRSFR